MSKFSALKKKIPNCFSFLNISMCETVENLNQDYTESLQLRKVGNRFRGMSWATHSYRF